MVVRLALLRDHLAHIIGEGIVVPDAHVLVDAARGAAHTTRPDALDEGQPSRVHKCREVVGRLGLPHDAGAGHELSAQHAVVDDPNSGQGGGGRHASVTLGGWDEGLLVVSRGSWRSAREIDSQGVRVACRFAPRLVCYHPSYDGGGVGAWGGGASALANVYRC